MNASSHWDRRWASRSAHMRRSAVRELLKLVHRPDMISFAGGLPAPELLPVEAIAEAAREVLASRGAAALQYGETEGLPELRDWIAARYSSDARPLDRSNVLITTGSQQALDLTGRVLLDEHDVALVENPTYLALLGAWRPTGARFEGLAADADGLCVDRLGSVQGSPRILYVVPNFQNPTGATLSPSRRTALVRWLVERDLVALEDDPYGELRYSGVPAPSLLELDAAHGDGAWRVLRTGTFSKTLAPGLRVGWIIGPADCIDRLVRAKQAVDLHTSSLDQAIVLSALKRGLIDRHRGALIAAYRSRRDAMVAALVRHLDGVVEWNQPEGGMFLWIRLPDGLDASRILEKALALGVAFVPGAEFHVGGDGDGAGTLRLNFTHRAEPEIELGIARLAEAIREAGIGSSGVQDRDNAPRVEARGI